MLSTFIPSLSKKRRTQRLKDLEESAKLIRSEIDKKLAEVKAIDKQLADALTDTKRLTHSVQEKLNMRLKITKNSLKTIMHNLRDGIILLDHTGKVIEMNLSSFKKVKSHFIGKSFNDLTDELEVTLHDGELLQIDPRFFEKLSKLIIEKSCSSLDCQECRSSISELEEYLDTSIAHPEGVKVNCGGEYVNCTVSFKIFDNSPETVRDVTYVIFVKRMQRREDAAGKFRTLNA